MPKTQHRIVYRGEIYYAHLSPSQGSEQGGSRPVIIIQNNVGNKHSPTTIVAPLTSQLGKTKLPTHVEFVGNGLNYQSIALLEQVRTIDKSRLADRIGSVPPAVMEEIDRALKISLGLS